MERESLWEDDMDNQKNFFWQLGQHIMIGFDGTVLTAEIKQFLAEYKIGNVILFRRNVQDAAQLRSLCEDLQNCIRQNTGIPAFIAMDQEGGTVARLAEDGVNVPGAMAIASAGGPALAYEAGQITARQLRSLGITFDLAPCMDINCNPDNPVIGVRSYGDTPEQVGAYGTQMIRGLQENHVLACAKHFPGHGDTDLDTHFCLPRITLSLEELRRRELLPFRQAVQAGAAGVMTAHILFPALEPEELPASMSRAIITGLLRKELGYEGLVLTDCMEMEAIASCYGTARGAVSALLAGADIALVSRTLPVQKETMLALEQAVEEGTLSREELERSTERILSVKNAMDWEYPTYDNREDLARTEQMLQQSLAGWNLPGGRLPDLGTDILFASEPSHRSAIVNNEEDQGVCFARFMAENLGGDSLILSQEPSEEERTALLASAQRHSSLVLGTYNSHLREEHRRILRSLGELNVPVLVVALGIPYDFQDVQEGTAGIAAWEYTERSLQEVPAVLKGD